MIYEKWRDLIIDPFTIDFKNLKLKEIISYPPAGNDVIEAICLINNQEENVFIKIERSKFAFFQVEAKHLQILNDNYYQNIPKIIELIKFNDKDVLVLSKIKGQRLSDILNNQDNLQDKDDYLYKYGQELAKIHNIPINKFNDAVQRKVNDYPQKEDEYLDDFIKPNIKWLKNNKPEINFETFIHGDFHYANILWDNKKINGVLDFELSGKGFKEQDIAWSLILRSTQKFMDNEHDINKFLEGYKSIGNYDYKKFKWCLINGYCHFYLMNMNNEEYKIKIKNLINKTKKDLFK